MHVNLGDDSRQGKIGALLKDPYFDPKKILVSLFKDKIYF